MTVVRRIQFEYLDNLSWDIVEASMERNALFARLSELYLKPFALAADMGRLTEETATKALAKLYAESVLVGSVCPELDALDYAGREQWLLTHPVEFATIRGIAEYPENFEDEDG